MRKINFLFAVHMHQPVGNFDGVFKFATEMAYLPFLMAMHDAPFFPFALHVSGPLWEYWEKHNPEIFDIVGAMVSREQCELLGGGFYEPILAVIPRRDAIAQLNTMSDFVQGKFGVKPRGIWLTERIWEPHLPELLHTAGAEYTCVDDYHFKSNGIIAEKLFGHYITEDGGHPVKIFPISEERLENDRFPYSEQRRIGRKNAPFRRRRREIRALARNAPMGLGRRMDARFYRSVKKEFRQNKIVAI